MKATILITVIALSGCTTYTITDSDHVGIQTGTVVRAADSVSSAGAPAGDAK